MRNKELSFQNLSLEYIDQNPPKKVINRFNQSFVPGKIITIIGENGSGKTTILNYIAGFKKDILKSDQDYDSSFWDIGYIIQNSGASLFNWMSPMENIIFPAKYSKFRHKEDLYHAKQLANYFEFNWDWGILTENLSGGQKQKLAIIRTLFKTPNVLLIDEGFVSIDYKSRNNTILKLRKWSKDKKAITINISHHIEEAVFFSDKIIILDKKENHDEFGIELIEPRNEAIKIDIKYGNYIQEIKSKTHF